MKYFLAGGAVRDMLLGVRPKDFDYVFSGSEEEFMNRHPEAHKLGGGPAYGLHKHEFVPLGKDIPTNLQERDFTINSFLLAEDGTLHMHPSALADLKGGRIIPASPASMLRDPLRIFRGARLSAEFPNFQLTQSTLELMAKAASTPEFLAIPAERVGRELTKAFACPAPGNFLRVLEHGKALKYWFNELIGAGDIPAGPPAYHNSDVLEHIATIMDKAAEELASWLQKNPDSPPEKREKLAVITAWMALAHDLGKVATPKDVLPHHYQHELRGVDAAFALAKRLKLSNRLRIAGALSARLHMKAGIYERLRPSTRVDLLMDAYNKRLFVPLFLVAQADSGLPHLLEKVQRELKAILAVKLPLKWEDCHEESGKHLREMRCAALIRLHRNKTAL